MTVWVPRVVNGQQRDKREAAKDLEGRNPKYRGCSRTMFQFECDPPKAGER